MPEADSAPDVWTIRRVLIWASEDFQRRQNPCARLDAELLLGRVLGMSRIDLIRESTRPLSAAELRGYRDLIQRRRRSEPVAYILGEREFFGLTFKVDPRVLIPRPDTEILVEVALGRSQSHELFGNALDLCTGSGCVVIALAKNRPTWRYQAVDLSEPALALARENALRTGTLPRIAFLQGNLFEPFKAGQRFDLIAANPPYVTQAEYAELMLDVRGFEPRLALEGGADGLDLIRPLVAQARAYLNPGGLLALEVGYNQASRVASLLEGAGFTEIRRNRDYAGHERVVSGLAA
jgi:release factor glutamine methyltransferase